MLCGPCASAMIAGICISHSSLKRRIKTDSFRFRNRRRRIASFRSEPPCLPFPLDTFRERIAALDPIRPIGRVRRISGDRLIIGGLGPDAVLGHEVTCLGAAGPLHAEIVSLAEDSVEAMPYATLAGLGVNAEVTVRGAATIAPSDSWLGRVVDPFGQPLDGRPITCGGMRPVHAPPPAPGRRGGFGARLSTGYVALDTLLPLAEGQRMGIFAGSGVGKSRLLGDLARDVDADIVVAALIGERGREVASFARDAMAASMARTIVVASDIRQTGECPAARLPAAIAVAERFRERGCARPLCLRQPDPARRGVPRALARA